ncbi:hypothetical protein KCP74_12315 [Salmonella enterica subsp. enterica]|nr:hypothetical protein KCP74_12315 [Salmonella enterica subsp. enterica]
MAIGLVVGVLDRIATLRPQLHLSGFLLAGKGGAMRYWRAGHLAVLAGHKRLRALLRKPFLSLYAAPYVHHEKCGCGHHIYRRRNNCIAAMTGARDS